MMNRLTNLWKDQSGVALVVAMIMMVVLTLIGIAATLTSTFEIKLGGNKRGSTDAFYTADAGLGVRALSSANFLNGIFTPVSSGSLPSDRQNEPIVSRFTSPVLPLPAGVNFTEPPQVIIYKLKPEGYGTQGGTGTTNAYIVDSTGRDQMEVGLFKSTCRVRAKYVDTVPDEMN